MARWTIVTARDDREWPCTIVDDEGRSLLGVHDGTPVIRDRHFAELLLVALNQPTSVARVRECVEELRLWRAGQRSMCNLIAGTTGEPEIEQRLIQEADTAQIMALAAELAAATFLATPAPAADESGAGA